VALYLDANIIVALLIPEPSSPAIFQFLYEATEPLLVSSFTAAEVASGVSRLARMGQMTTDVAHLTLADFDDWRLAETQPLEIDDFDIVQAAQFVRRFDLKLRMPDALHLAVCLRAGARLVTHDHTLADAAAACGVAAVRP
jgi:hypothetical protein